MPWTVSSWRENCWPPYENLKGMSWAWFWFSSPDDSKRALQYQDPNVWVVLPKTPYWRLLPTGILESVRTVLSLIFALIVSAGDSSYTGKHAHTDTHTHKQTHERLMCTYTHAHKQNIHTLIHTGACLGTCIPLIHIMHPHWQMYWRL